jgi:hypothetical protein
VILRSVIQQYGLHGLVVHDVILDGNGWKITVSLARTREQKRFHVPYGSAAHVREHIAKQLGVEL